MRRLLLRKKKKTGPVKRLQYVPYQLRCQSDSTKSQDLLLADFKITNLEATRLAGRYTIFPTGWLESLGATVLMQVKITVALTTFQQFEACVSQKALTLPSLEPIDCSPQVTETRSKAWQ